MRQHIQIFRFAIIGGAAALVHLIAVAILVPRGIQPLWANAIAFALAWHVSYYGHRSFTFRTKGNFATYSKMLGTSLTSLAFQEVLYALLLRTTPLDYRLSLIIVLLLAAAGTFLASRYWVFTTHIDTR